MGIYVATGSKVIDVDGQRMVIIKGRTTAEDGAAILAACPGLFTPLVPTHRGDQVEQATAAPGERRNVQLPEQASDTARKATAKKKSAAKKKSTKTKDPEPPADPPDTGGGDDGPPADNGASDSDDE